MLCLPATSPVTPPPPRVRRGKLVRRPPPNRKKDASTNVVSSVSPRTPRRPRKLSRARTRSTPAKPHLNPRTPSQSTAHSVNNPGLKRQMMLLWKRLRNPGIPFAKRNSRRFSFMPPGFVRIDIPQEFQQLRNCSGSSNDALLQLDDPTVIPSKKWQQ
ncbi:hypothetical protein CC1G_14834 [Coprinopsis cinerea okayama7|uniref:Uncharacterized protein n=1 Tax=Coprinopsis cinerea (strain Okayama-7 / 130 / ATCC MYA-4618 / FGSC 9003) TaxID=240176 RepID=D6RNI4_COPC7|nr:hypothetical protein CC1G_14834 [Coprinopsis cinerea okayama7\|eukprot:XP_002910855.1 hypothetical protein CC1G_14834 [Coprinopsis cinerea okayama7\